MWDDKLGAFVDYDWRNEPATGALTAATAYPLFVDLVDASRRIAWPARMRRHRC